MASINNLNEVANNALQDALQKGAVIDSFKTGIQEFTVDDLKVFTSSVRDINLNIGDANHAILTGNSDLDIVGNSNDNFIVGNDGNNWIDAGDGNDQVSTGAGDDVIFLGAGDDVIEIDGPGNKIINGGEGNDLFVIKAGLGENSHVTLTGLNVGDKVRVYADANGDGKINWDDVQSADPDENGNVKFVLKDGSSFTLEGVGNKDDITYTIGEDGDGLYVELS